MTAEKFKEETKRQSSILLLNASFRKTGEKVYMICEDSDLREYHLEINNDFARNYSLQKTKLLIIMGANAS